MKINRIINLLIIAFFTVFCALSFNAYYQSKLQYSKLLSKNQIAVFVKKQHRTDSLEVIKEKIINLNGISDVKLKTPEDIIKEMNTLSPVVSEILISGENPFNSYFIVIPSEVKLESIKSLKDKLMTFEGVEEVKFDENRVVIIEKLGKLMAFHKFVIKSALLMVLFLVLVKNIVLWGQRLFVFEEFVYQSITGIISGFLGWGIYSFFSRYLILDSIVQIPARYLPYLLICALLASLVLKESKQ